MQTCEYLLLRDNISRTMQQCWKLQKAQITTYIKTSFAKASLPQCSGSVTVVVTAYGFESGRPDSNPQ